MLKKKNVMGWLVLTGFLVCATRLYNSTSKEKKELRANCPGQQKNNSAQCIEVEGQVAPGKVSWLWKIICGLGLVAIGSTVLSFQIKRVADFAAIFLLFLATVILALQPESDGTALSVRQKKHIYTAIALVVVGMIMQISSFELSGREAIEIEKRISQFDSRLKALEKANIAQADALAHAKSEIQTMKEATKTSRVKQLPASTGVSHSVHSRQEGKLQQEVQK